ncbi:MAG TPA: phage holin family protein [Rhodocyclaceae bacterium]|nr:phage holin family protein [Rhodocyclaceae bacterium]
MAAPAQAGGLFASLRGLLASGIELLHNRLELFGTELEEEKLRLLGLLAYGAAAFFLFGAGVVFLGIFLTVLFWDSNRLLVLAFFTAAFLIGGGFALYKARAHAHAETRLFAASLAELARDRAALTAEERGGQT